MKKCFLFLSLLTGLYALLWIGAHRGQYTKYVPLTGALFSVDAGAVDGIAVQSGQTGMLLEYDTAEEKEEVASLLNGFRSHLGVPALPVAMGGWEYRVIIRDGGESTPYLIGTSWVKAGSVYFYGQHDYFGDLITALNAAEEVNGA